MRRTSPLLVALGLLLGACTGERGTTLRAVVRQEPPTTLTTTTTTTAPPPPTTTPTTLPQAAVAGDGRPVLATGFRPFATVGGVVLTYPSPRVEKVGFHESTLLGARALELLPTTGPMVDLPTRDRKTAGRTAADILSDPSGEVRAPVTGTVKRGGTYTLYCKYTDSFAVIAPDAQPDWEVKVLHVTNLMIKVGQRVEAGVTPLAQHPTRLPFASQVEDVSVAPVWPHVHVEIVDPSIKNPPGVGGGGCS